MKLHSKLRLISRVIHIIGWYKFVRVVIAAMKVKKEELQETMADEAKAEAA